VHEGVPKNAFPSQIALNVINYESCLSVQLIEGYIVLLVISGGYLNLIKYFRDVRGQIYGTGLLRPGGHGECREEELVVT
jgi:hypothetical protein